MTGFFSFEATTNGITVRVQPQYAPDQSDPKNGYWAWHYHIRIENKSGGEVQLIDRHWIITNGHGQQQTVKGAGVVGDQPILPDGGSYDYVSGCPLSTPMGHMRGEYGMVDSNGHRFAVEIPGFDLVSPDLKRVAN